MPLRDSRLPPRSMFVADETRNTHASAKEVSDIGSPPCRRCSHQRRFCAQEILTSQRLRSDIGVPPCGNRYSSQRCAHAHGGETRRTTGVPPRGSHKRCSRQRRGCRIGEPPCDKRCSRPRRRCQIGEPPCDQRCSRPRRRNASDQWRTAAWPPQKMFTPKAEVSDRQTVVTKGAHAHGGETCRTTGVQPRGPHKRCSRPTAGMSDRRTAV